MTTPFAISLLICLMTACTETGPLPPLGDVSYSLQAPPCPNEPLGKIDQCLQSIEESWIQ
jgi:hypothetical protein